METPPERGPGADPVHGSPFPGAAVVGVGVDAVDLPRFRRVLARRPAMAERIFTDQERADAGRRPDPAPPLAARFAAKEATMKALGRGLGAFPLRDVEVVTDQRPGPGRGAPALRLGPEARRVSDDRGVTAWHVSLTHTDQVAMAVVVAERAPGGLPPGERAAAEDADEPGVGSAAAGPRAPRGG